MGRSQFMCFKELKKIWTSRLENCRVPFASQRWIASSSLKQAQITAVIFDLSSSLGTGVRGNSKYPESYHAGKSLSTQTAKLIHGKRKMIKKRRRRKRRRC